MQKHPHDLPASVKQRLLNLAKKRQEEFQNVLTRFAAERFLYRLGRSDHRSTFILKGATVFAQWTGDLQRPTRDLDAVLVGKPPKFHALPLS